MQPTSLAALAAAPAAPAAGFEHPFEMLQACHARMQRMVALLARLRAHLGQHGADLQARQAARDVMRYFDEAAPHHHRDEELHVFPALLAHGDAAQCALVDRLLREHRAMEAGWSRARAVLGAIADGAQPRLAAADDAALDAFAGLYADHIAQEEGLAYPAALARLDGAALVAMGAEMGARRGVKPRPADAAAAPSGGHSPKTAGP